MAFLKSFSLVNSVLFPAPRPSYDTRPPTRKKAGTLSTLILIPLGEHKFPALFVEPADPKGELLIYFHGNAVDVGYIHDVLIDLSSKLRVYVLALEYPGYGMCPHYGHIAPSEASIDRFAEAAWNFAIRQLRFDPGEIILFGRSIGTGPAARLASVACSKKQNPGALILQSPYTSIKGLVRGFGSIGKFGSILMLQRWDTQNAIKDMLVPVLILHGDLDTLISLSNGQAIAKSRKNSKLPAWCITELFVMRGADHNRFDRNSQVVLPIQRFMRQIRGAPAAASAATASAAAASAAEVEESDGRSQSDLQSRIQYVQSQRQKFDSRASKDSGSSPKSNPIWKIGLVLFGVSMAVSEAAAGTIQSSVSGVKSAQEQLDEAEAEEQMEEAEWFRMMTIN